MQELVEAHARSGQTHEAQEFVSDRMNRFRNQSGQSWEQTQPDGRTMLINEKQTASGGLVSVRTDITALKQAEMLLRNRLAAIEAAEEGIAITDPDGNFIYMNHEHLQMFGFESLGEIEGQNWKLLYSPEVISVMENECFPALIRDGSWRGHADGLRRDGTSFPQEISLTLLEDGGLVCATRDITARLENESQKALLREQFNEAQKWRRSGVWQAESRMISIIYWRPCLDMPASSSKTLSQIPNCRASPNRSFRAAKEPRNSSSSCSPSADIARADSTQQISSNSQAR